MTCPVHRIRSKSRQRRMVLFAFLFGWLTMWLYSYASRDRLTKADELRITREVVNNINGAAKFQAQKMLLRSGEE